ncbi:MAG: GAF domain-containing protein [Rhodospirillales bacterium]
MMHDTDQLSTLSAFTRQAGEAKTDQDAFRAADEAAGRLVGHRLCTIMAFHPETMEVERCYTSNPDAYPAGGRKQKRDSEWGEHVLLQGRYFIGYNADDIRRNFNDHELIDSLGLRSILNIPVRCLGRTIGTLNLLHEAGYYNESQVGLASVIASGLAGTLMAR